MAPEENVKQILKDVCVGMCCKVLYHPPIPPQHTNTLKKEKERKKKKKTRKNMKGEAFKFYHLNFSKKWSKLLPEANVYDDTHGLMNIFLLIKRSIVKRIPMCVTPTFVLIFVEEILGLILVTSPLKA